MPALSHRPLLRFVVRTGITNSTAVGAVTRRRPARRLQLEVADTKRERLGDPQAAADQKLGQRPIDVRAGVEVARDLVQPQVLPLDVRGRKPLDLQRWVDGQQAILDRRIETDDERPERGVRRLWCQLAGINLLGQLGNELANVVHGELPERARSERRQQTLAPDDLIPGPRAALEVRPTLPEPPFPIAGECLLGVAHLPPLDLLDQPAPGIACGALAREPALGGLSPVAAPIQEPPLDSFRSAVRVDARAATVPRGVGTAGVGGDLRECLVQGVSGFLGLESAGTPTAVRITPADLPAAAMEANAHEYVHRVVTAP